MGIFISVGKTAECVVIALAFAAFLTAISLKPVGMLQACGYKGGKLFGWLKKKNNLAQTRLNLLAFASILACAVIGLCFSFLGSWAAVISLAAYLIFFILYIYADARVALKSPATPTPRFKRVLVVVFLLYAVFAYLAVTLLNFADYVWGQHIFSCLRYCPLALIAVLVYPFVALANCVTLIYEIPKNKGYTKKAKGAIAQSGITVVGVTGSYGKTSVKNILCALLSGKYRVLATPRSYNTPLGIAKCVNGEDLSKFDILIAEMGARNVGDIAELCALCPPTYSAITGICPQHLESFKTLENIVKAKGEIISATAKTCFISPDCFDYFAHSAGSIAKSDCVSEVCAGADGTDFTLTLGGKAQRVHTKLLGAHSAYNIGLCADIAFALGVSAEEIAAAIPSIDFVEHRLQLIESNGVNILDDGYNSNVVGARAALDVLRTMSGKKIVVTPGLVELGILEEEENKALGGCLVGLDYVILVGETLVTAVKNGYVESGGDIGKICIVPTLAAAQDKLKEVLTKGDSVLFLNDLPDIYI